MQLPVIVLGVLLLDGAAAQATQVQWSGDRLTVNAVNASLRALVEDVAQRAGIVVTGIDRLAGGRSIQIRDASLYEGLKVLLQGVNFVIVNVNAGEMAFSTPGFFTVTIATPPTLSSAAGMCAVSSLALTTVVGYGVPFQSNVAPGALVALETKLPPAAVMTKPAPPTEVVLGFNAFNTGAPIRS